MLAWLILVVFATTALHMAITYSRSYTIVRGHRIVVNTFAGDKLARAFVLGLGTLGAIQLARLRASAVGFFMVALFARAALALYDLSSSASSRHIGAIIALELASLTLYAFCFAYSLTLRQKMTFQ